MRALALHGTQKPSMLGRLAPVVFVCILVLHGTYIRTRSGVAAPKVDWLVLAQVLTCATGFGVGLLLMRRVLPFGFGAKALLLYGLAALVSALGCPHSTTVIGYSILLLGASLLTIVLVYTATNLSQLRTIEKLWFVTVMLLVVKDTIISQASGGMGADDAVGRLGMGVTHPNQISLLAAVLFWLSFGDAPGRHVAAKWLLRALLIYVLIAAKTRISILAFVTAGACYSILSAKDSLKRSVVVGAVTGALLTLLLFSLFSSQSWAGSTVDYLKRGQDKAGLTTLTGRTVIWRHALPKTMETPIVGHGYGVTRLTMGKPRDAGFQPQHCHNTLLEVFFSTGLFGLIPFVMMLLYCLKWIVRFPRLRRVFSSTLALHAVCTIVILLVASLFEAKLCAKLTLFHPLFFFYMVALDREKQIAASVQANT